MHNYLANLQQKLSTTNQILIAVKITPNANKSEWVGILEQEGSRVLKTKIAAVPEKGKANKELISFLSKEFHTPKSQIEIIGGHTTPHKLIRIRKTI